MEQQVHAGRINLVFRPQGSQRAYPRHDVEVSSPLREALLRLFIEDLKATGLPSGLRATLTKTGVLLDIAKSPGELGLQAGDQVSLAPIFLRAGFSQHRCPLGRQGRGTLAS